MDSTWIIIVLVVVIIALLIINTNSSNFSSEIPKTIWTYWDSPNLPETVKKCIETWKKYNPDYEVIVLSDDKIKTYLPETDVLGMKMADKPQRRSDFIRIHIIEKYGGIWCDASIMLNGSLEFIRSKTGYEFVGYHIGKMMNSESSPVIENWFMAAPPGSDFIRKWRETFVKINNFNDPNDYVKSIQDQGVDISKVESPDYLTMHVASQHVIQKQMEPNSVYKKLYLMKAEDGPLKYLSTNDWDSSRGIASICKNDTYDHPVIKFRGTERNVIESDPRLNCIFD
jgi:hypothetical protein